MFSSVPKVIGVNGSHANNMINLLMSLVNVEKSPARTASIVLMALKLKLLIVHSTVVGLNGLNGHHATLLVGMEKSTERGHVQIHRLTIMEIIALVVTRR